jgi:hypothetical protein
MVVYASAAATQPKYTISGHPTIQYADCGNPIQFTKSSDESGFSISSTIPFLVFKTGLPSPLPDSDKALSTNEERFASRYLRHTFYVVINIHAP